MRAGSGNLRSLVGHEANDADVGDDPAGGLPAFAAWLIWIPLHASFDHKYIL